MVKIFIATIYYTSGNMDVVMELEQELEWIIYEKLQALVNYQRTPY